MSEDIYDRLQNWPLQDHDQYVGYREYYRDSLTNFTKQYYESSNQDIIYGSVQELKFSDEILHCPENCQSDAQKSLIYHHIFLHCKMNLHNIGMINYRPPFTFVLVDDKPGTGKYFVTQTFRKITRLLTKQNSSYMASYTTGCATDWIGGCSINRALRPLDGDVDVKGLIIEVME